MRRSFLKYFSIVFFFFSSMVIWGQSPAQSTLSFILPEVALVGIRPNANTAINLSLNPILEAGNPVKSAGVNSSLWLNYSIAIASGGTSRNISVSVDRLIPGVDIVLETQKSTSGSLATLGEPTPKVIVGTIPVHVITGIKGAYTGFGERNGHNLKYSLQVNDYSKLVETNDFVTITYTISN